MALDSVTASDVVDDVITPTIEIKWWSWTTHYSIYPNTKKKKEKMCQRLNIQVGKTPTTATQ